MSEGIIGTGEGGMGGGGWRKISRNVLFTFHLHNDVNQLQSFPSYHAFLVTSGQCGKMSDVLMYVPVQ